MICIRDLISKYDCIAWVPTIRGALSLNLIEDADNIFGDVDKYSITIKDYDELHAKHYIAASSLTTVNDSKHGVEYIRTFRYNFYGTIGVDNNKDNDLDECLIGHLSIVAADSVVLTNRDVNMLNLLKEMTVKKALYNNQYNVEAASMETLASTRKELVSLWRKVRNVIKCIEEDEQRVTFRFEVCLTRDGILLIKDETSDEYKTYYAEKNTEDDYTKHLPVHRIFKLAMDFVKYIFHTNYHHNMEHDTLLPASNLHPWRGIDKAEYYDHVFRHQLDAMLNPITEFKRKGCKGYTINAEGILLYAQAMTNVFVNNGLISKDSGERSLRHIEIQKEELSLLMQPSKHIISTFMAQKNVLFISTGVLAAEVAVLKIVSGFSWWSLVCKTNVNYAVFLIVSIISLLILYVVYLQFKTSQRFILVKPQKQWFFKNSDLKKKKLSNHYQLWIWLNDVKLMFGVKKYIAIKLGLLIIVLIIALVSMWAVYYYYLR